MATAQNEVITASDRVVIWKGYRAIGEGDQLSRVETENIKLIRFNALTRLRKTRGSSNGHGERAR